jgi:tetratricopeptide (TPR) repeat protein
MAKKFVTHGGRTPAGPAGLKALRFPPPADLVSNEAIYRKIFDDSASIQWLWLFQLGIIMQDRGLYEDAVKLYDRALRIDPYRSEVHCYRGIALWRRNPAAALQSFDRALAIRPNFVEALYNRAYALNALGRYAEAIATYDQLIAVRPDDSVARLGRERAVNAQRESTEEIANYDQPATRPGKEGGRQVHGEFDAEMTPLGVPDRAADPADKSPFEIDEGAYKLDSRAQALLRGARIAQDDLRAAGGAYDLDQVRTLMRGISRQAIDKRVHEGSLLAVPGPNNRRSYPTLQFNDDGSVVEGLKLVRQALPTTNLWTILNFLARPDDRLFGRKPIDMLKAGEIDLVVEAARRVGQQGA